MCTPPTKMIVFIRVIVTLFVLPGLVKVFSSVSHSTRGSQPLTKRSRGHIHKLLLLHPRTHKKRCTLLTPARAKQATADGLFFISKWIIKAAAVKLLEQQLWSGSYSAPISGLMWTKCHWCLQQTTKHLCHTGAALSRCLCLQMLCCYLWKRVHVSCAARIL